MGCAPSLQAGYILTTTYYSVTFKTAIFSFTHSLLNCCIFAPQVVLCDSSIASMEFKEYQKVGLMKKKVMIIFLLTFLVFGHKNTTVIAMNKNKMVMLSQTQQKPQQQQQQQEEEERQEQSLKHSVEVFFSSKRRVPNASDPLHNRWCFKFWFNSFSFQIWTGELVYKIPLTYTLQPMLRV